MSPHFCGPMPWLAPGTCVERELDDVSDIWAAARVISVSEDAATADVIYVDDGKTEVGVPVEELRPCLHDPVDEVVLHNDAEHTRLETADLDLEDSTLKPRALGSKQPSVVVEPPQVETAHDYGWLWERQRQNRRSAEKGEMVPLRFEPPTRISVASVTERGKPSMKKPFVRPCDRILKVAEAELQRLALARRKKAEEQACLRCATSKARRSCTDVQDQWQTGEVAVGEVSVATKDACAQVEEQQQLGLIAVGGQPSITTVGGLYECDGFPGFDKHVNHPLHAGEKGLAPGAPATEDVSDDDWHIVGGGDAAEWELVGPVAPAVENARG